MYIFDCSIFIIVHTHTYIHTYIHIYIYMCVCRYACMHECRHQHRQADTLADRQSDVGRCKQTHIHASMYTHRYSFCKTSFWGGCSNNPTSLHQAKELRDVLASTEASAELGAGELHHLVASAAQPEPVASALALHFDGTRFQTWRFDVQSFAPTSRNTR